MAEGRPKKQKAEGRKKQRRAQPDKNPSGGSRKNSRLPEGRPKTGRRPFHHGGHGGHGESTVKKPAKPTKPGWPKADQKNKRSKAAKNCGGRSPTKTQAAAAAKTMAEGQKGASPTKTGRRPKKRRAVMIFR
ncbi:MAG: hypothetical protein CMN32_08315 [Saprospirales bacterium]|nr:hypothetical protein [Saprospirales bacterium]